MGFENKALVIDGKDHLLGRLASIVAKQLLNGERIVIVRCEAITISGNFHRSKLKYLSFLRKACNVRPSKGPFHYRAPGRIFWRTVRGMVPHKTDRGQRAMMRLKCFEGMPSPWDHRVRKVAPSALRHMCLQPGRRFCRLGRLSAEVGWKYEGVVKKLEGKRKLKSTVYHKRTCATTKLRAAAVKSLKSKIAPYQKVIESYGFN